MSVMICIRHKTKEFYTLVLNPCQLAIEPLAKPLSDLLLLDDQAHWMDIAGPDSVCLPATSADSPHVSLLMILLLAKDLSLNRGKRLDQAYGAFIEIKNNSPHPHLDQLALAHMQNSG